MIIHARKTIKKQKVSEKKKIENQRWLDSLPKSKVAITGTYSSATRPSLIPLRNTPHIPSVKTDLHDCTKKKTNFYTGDKMLGIGTLHKSNAVPIFNNEDAKDQATMRR